MNIADFPYQKYRWFFTKAGVLVVGGKSADQNDELLVKIKSNFDENFTTLHTSAPGSPFAIILSEKKLTPSDLKEAAIFTACFSQAWKQKKKTAEIHLFSINQLKKSPTMKQGTWSVLGKIKTFSVKLKLALTIQNNILRAVPIPTIKNKKEIYAIILPGNLDKSLLVPSIQEFIPSVTKDEILAALPAGGIALQQQIHN